MPPKTYGVLRHMSKHLSRYLTVPTHIWGLFNKEEKVKATILLIMMAFGAGLELVGISQIVPFLHLITNPQIITTQPQLFWVYSKLGLSDPNTFIIIVGIVIFSVYLFKNIYFAFFYYFQSEFLAKKRASLVRQMLTMYLRTPYTFHLQRNTSEFITNLGDVTKIVDGICTPLSVLVTETLIVGVIIIFLFIVQPAATLTAIIFLGGITYFFYRLVQKRIANWASEKYFHSREMNKWLLQGLHAVKEIKLFNIEDYIIAIHTKHFQKFSKLFANSSSLNQMPRLFIETIIAGGVMGFVIIAILLGSTTAGLIPVLALFAVAAFRMMPSMSRIVLSAMAIKENAVAVELVFKTLPELGFYKDYSVSSKGDDIHPMGLNNSLEIKDVVYRYENAKVNALDGLSLSIKRGESVAFVGPSGAGKSTLIDILLGLLPLSHGSVTADNRNVFENLSSWQKMVGYIPQNVHLMDDTLRRNIAFGIEDDSINDEQIWKALKVAQLDKFIRSLPDGINTMIGENGVRFSGGQKQRIGIARALYRDPQVLVLDEATSALDIETELAFIQAIEELKHHKTIIIISHRLSIAAKCDKVFFLRNGKLVGEGLFKDLINTNQDFNSFVGDF